MARESGLPCNMKRKKDMTYDTITLHCAVTIPTKNIKRFNGNVH
jgi:hypothetical protein